MVFGSFRRNSTAYHIAPQDDMSDSSFAEKQQSSQPLGISRFGTLLLNKARTVILTPWFLVSLLVLSHTYLLTTGHGDGYKGKPHGDPWMRSSSNYKPVFSPAEEAIEYHDITYTSGFGKIEISEYQGAPNEVNAQAWSDLYNFGISRIPMSDARELANRTVPIPDDPGHYAIGLDVFHQLHCLNMVRLRVWAAETFVPEHELMGMEHIDHCIDTIRQSLMCASDVTPLPFVWIESERKTMEVARVLHTCRNFDKVREWGLKNHIGKFDRNKRVEDPLDHDPDVKGVMTFS